MFEGTRQRHIATQFEYPGYIWRTIPNTRFTDSRGFRRPELPDQKKKTRPRTQREDSSRPFYASKTTARQYYGDLLATTDGTAIYNEVHRLCTDLQQDVTRQHDNAHTCDLSAFIEQLEQRQLDGQLNPHIKIFREDACHLYEFAEQQMAEFVALTIAPQHRDRIERHIASFTYNARTAHQLLTEEQPGGALVLREQSGRRFRVVHSNWPISENKRRGS